MYSMPHRVHHIKEVVMLRMPSPTQVLLFVFVVAAMLTLPLNRGHAVAAEGQGKVKVLYHVDGKDPEVAKYALALINKHIDAEGGPDKIDVELVVHGPALELFEKDKMDPEMTKRFDQIIEKGAKAEMCQVSMKAFGKTIDNLAKGFVATLHPVAVKRIADLQREGYLYIKP
jgi:intracellular sulfur oxidation DsrE/DsrF family protein